MKVSKETIIELVGLYVGGKSEEEVITDSDPSETTTFIKIQDLPVDDQGKYQNEGYIFLDAKHHKFYQYWCMRSGSYFSDYDYQYDEDKEGNIELQEVYMQPVTAFRWVVKK